MTSAELTALAAIGEGKYAQAFPSFGPERRGAPVMAFVRVSETPIVTREKVYEPNIVIVLDPTLLKIVNVEAGLQKGGIVILNTTKSAETDPQGNRHKGQARHSRCFKDCHGYHAGSHHQHYYARCSCQGHRELFR